ncbi:serine hydrolase domain-containing protein [Catellatospora bangladeshensis]|uniref:D-alanyl-D-alanine carboxypeptidase n=2 Tax=Saccharothrix algeriensis TaxID=173560 RepID=A0ABS2SFF8_9PSEU|nr:D-alanyl-D-alanine carboxypeptidase [Saccharothrix algeriensis]
MTTALCLAVAGPAGVPVGAAVAAPETSELSRTVQRDADALLAQGVPGVLVGVDARRGDFTVRSGHGDLDAKTPVPWNAHFRIGSFTKAFVATTVLQLVGERRLSLEDTVDRWLPGVVAGNGNDGRAITIRQLLQHTSGLHDYARELPFLSTREGFLKSRFDTVTAAEAVRLGVSKPPTFAPGAGWSYSNTGYALVGMVIERVTGRTWQQEVTARVIRPLGLGNTHAPYTSPHIPGPHAKGYDRFPEGDAADPEWGPRVDVTLQNPSWGGAAGAMTGTVDDGNRFLRALLGGRVLRPDLLAEMKRTVRAPQFDDAWPGARYGLGIMWTPNSCGGAWSHGGTIHGYLTRNGVTDDGDRSVVVSMNTRTPVPTDGSPPAEKDPSTALIDHALCG